MLIPKILKRLEEEKKPRVLVSSSRPECGWITSVPSVSTGPGWLDPTLGDLPGLRKMEEWVQSCLGAPLPHGLPGPLEVAAARRIATLCPSSIQLFLSLFFFILFLFSFSF